MDQVPGDVLALFIEEVQRLAQGAVGSFCFHPLPPPRLGFARQRKLLTQLPNLACRAGCTPIHLGNPGWWRRVSEAQGRCARLPLIPIARRLQRRKPPSASGLEVREETPVGVQQRAWHPLDDENSRPALVNP